MFELGIDTHLFISIIEDEGGRWFHTEEIDEFRIDFYTGRDGISIGQILLHYDSISPKVAKGILSQLNMADLIPLIFTPKNEEVTIAPNSDSCLVCNGTGVVPQGELRVACTECKGTGSKTFALGNIH